MSSFKAYDIRGIYGEDLTNDLVYKVGFFLPRFLGVSSVVVGRDIRLSSEAVARHLFVGITDAGADVYDLGLTSTPALYFATGFDKAKASIQITASHNPKEYNGLKISREHVISLGGESGDLQKLEQIVMSEIPNPQNHKKGKVIPRDITQDYLSFLSQYVVDLSSLHVGIDTCNGMAGLYVKNVMEKSGAKVKYICEKMDGNFPCHEPNPLVEENCELLKQLVLKSSLDVGLIFDGDADRVMVIDEKGSFVRPDLVIAMLASHFLAKHTGATIVVDIRTSRAVTDFIRLLGGKVIMWRVGHAYAIEKIAETGAIFGGELAGHYYFKDFYNCDSGILAALLILKEVKELKKQGITLSQSIKNLDIYHNSGEINFVIEEKNKAMAALAVYAQTVDTLVALFDFDGYRFEYKDWWFNVRKSNTEPYLRLILEAEDVITYEQRLTQIKGILENHVIKKES